jgi:hypothetical protein
MNIFSTKAKYLLSFVFAALLAAGTLTSCNNAGNAGPGSSVQVQNPSQPDLTNAIDIQNRHTDDLLNIDGVIGTGAGYHTDGTPAIYVFTSRADVAGIPASIEGVGTLIQNIGEVKALGYSGSSQLPTQSGYSVGNDNECAAGTISCVVTDNQTHTKMYLLSNNHVFARVNKAAIGEHIDQPGRYDAVPQCSANVTHEANLSRFISINFGRRASNTVDCAIAELMGGITATTASAGGYTPTTTTEAPVPSMAVEKTGRTTGTTTGTIAAVNVTVSVSYGGGQTAKFVGQIYISSTTFSGAGDSGSLIVDSNTLNPVGLLFAGSANSTIANPITSVLKALNVSIVPPPPAL